MHRLPLCLLLSVAPLFLALAGTARAQTDEYLQCYNYTWTGKNVSVDCDDHRVDILNQDQPCLYTLIYTNPYTDPPNTSALPEHCASVQRCPSYICKTKSSCIQLMWYDVAGTLVNYSSFCGSVTDMTDPSKINTVHDVTLEMEVGTYMKRMKVCSTHLCNAAATPAASPATILTVVVMVALAARMALGVAWRGVG